MAANDTRRLDTLAEELTRRLGIPFRPTTNGTIVFRDKLRVTDWAVPLMFDGHAARDHDALIPTDFVGHLLWPTLRASREVRNERPWWYCTMSVKVANALLDVLREDDDEPLDDGGWLVGRDVLLEEVFPTPATTTPRRRVA
jgi:hypothetical protein